MKIIGLCGGSGSGKTDITKRFAEYGYSSINADAVYHQLSSNKTECLEALVKEFGEEILNDEGTLDRKKLGEIVFSKGNDEKRVRLNEISHKYVLDFIRKVIQQEKENNIPAIIIDAPLLFESGFNNECDITIAVIADKELRLDRISKRDGISKEAAAARINTQMSDDFLIKNCDFVIENNSDFDNLDKSVAKIAEKIREIN